MIELGAMGSGGQLCSKLLAVACLPAIMSGQYTSGIQPNPPGVPASGYGAVLECAAAQLPPTLGTAASQPGVRIPWRHHVRRAHSVSWSSVQLFWPALSCSVHPPGNLFLTAYPAHLQGCSMRKRLWSGTGSYCASQGSCFHLQHTTTMCAFVPSCTDPMVISQLQMTTK